MRDYFADLLHSVQALGVDTEVTLHALLFSGATDLVTGHPTKGWTDSTVDMVIEPVGAPLQVFDTGLYAGLKAKAFTKVALSDGDEVTDSFSNLWIVLSVLPFQVGDTAVYKQCELALALISSYSHPAPAVYPTPALGICAPIVLHIDCIVDTEIVTPTVATIQGIVKAEILAPTVAAIGGIVDTEILAPTEATIETVVTITPDVPRWFIDCAYNIMGALNPTGLQVVASAATLAVTSTADTANGYVQASATPFSLDDATFHHGTVNSAGTGSYTVPAQTDNTWHQLSGYFAVGWGSYATGTSADGYSYNVFGASKQYTATGDPGVGNHWHIKLDGGGGSDSPRMIAAQANGTYHTVTTEAVLNP